MGRVVILAVLLLSGIALNVANPQFVRHFIDLAKQQGDLPYQLQSKSMRHLASQYPRREA